MITRYRPTADGSNMEIANESPNGTGHAAIVSITDDLEGVDYLGTDYLYTAYNQVDTFLFSNPTERGRVDGITVSILCFNYYNNYASSCRTAIFTAGQTIQYGAWNVMPKATRTYQKYSKVWALNPWTGVAWTWADLDALEIGASLNGTSGAAFCGQIYIDIESTKPASRRVPLIGPIW